jgi:hypothetical protein
MPYEVIGFLDEQQPVLQEPSKQQSQAKQQKQKTFRDQKKEDNNNLWGFVKDIPKAVSGVVSGFADVPLNLAKGYIASQSSQIPHKLRSGNTEIAKREQEEADRNYERLSGKIPTGKQALESVLPEGTLESNTNAGKHLHEAAETFGSYLFPLPGSKIGSLGGLARAGIASTAGQAAKLGNEYFGGSEDMGNKFKLGAQFGVNLLGSEGIRKQAARFYKNIQESVPKGLRVSNKPLTDVINKIRNTFTGVGDVGVESKVKLDDILSRAQDLGYNGKTSVKDLIDFKQDLGQRYSELKKLGDKRALPYFVEFNKGINNLLKNNPEVPKNIARSLSDADQIWSHIANYEKIKGFIKGIPGVRKILSPSTALLAGIINPQATIKAIAKGIPIAAAASTIGKGAHEIYGILSKPGVRRAYGRLFTEAANKSVPGVIKEAKTIEKMISRKKEEGRYEVIGFLD